MPKIIHHWKPTGLIVNGRIEEVCQVCDPPHTRLRPPSLGETLEMFSTYSVSHNSTHTKGV